MKPNKMPQQMNKERDEWLRFERSRIRQAEAVKAGAAMNAGATTRQAEAEAEAQQARIAAAQRED